MLIPFLALQQYIKSQLQDVQNVFIWNNNVQKLLAGEDWPYQLDTVFIDFPDFIKWDQLGNGVQSVDPLEIKFHYVSAFYDAQDGTQDQNLDIFIKLDALRDKLQDWMPTTFTIGTTDALYSKFAGTYQAAFGQFSRTGEVQDKDHGAVYHFIQSYTTSWVDQSRIRPVGGSTAGNLGYELDKVTEWATGNLYTAASPVNYVSYLGNIYKCILNTTVAYEPPTNATYWEFVTKQ